MDTKQQVVFAAVVLVRLIVPLFIPRYPLPTILLSLIVDGIDQTVFQAFHMTSVLAGYQSYDKALDVYYLVIAYTATMRNWHDPAAFRVGQFLWYWRLVGVVIFEFTAWQPVLLIFPNTFEYFFIAYEAIMIGWWPDRLSRKRLVQLAAAIWIVVKIPQEWWIHVAQLDATDEITRHPIIAAVFFAALAAVVGVAIEWGRSHAPAPDRRFHLNADGDLPRHGPDLRPLNRRTWLLATTEKVLLTGALVAIFGHILPTDASPGAIAIGMGTVALLNAAISEGLEWLRWMPGAFGLRFALMLALNAVLFEIIDLVRGSVAVNHGSAAFLLLLLSLVITLFDQFRGAGYGITMRWPGRSTTASVAGAS